MAGVYLLPIKQRVCECNGCNMIRCDDGSYWCPHMGGSVEQHFRWQEANKLPPVLCKWRKEVGRE